MSQRIIEIAPSKRRSPWPWLAAGLLGLNLWAMASLVPAVVESSPFDWRRTFPLVFLGVGLALYRSSTLARIALLALFPLAVGLSMVGTDDERLPALIRSLLLAASLAAYLAAGSHAIARAGTELDAIRRTNPAARPPPPPLLARSLRSVLIGSTVLGTVVLAIVAPLWDGRQARAATFGQAEGAAFALMATTGTILALIVLCGYLAPATRTSKTPRIGSTSRAMLYLAIATAAGATLFYVGFR